MSTADLGATLRGEVFVCDGRRYRFMTKTEAAKVMQGSVIQVAIPALRNFIYWVLYAPRIDHPVIDLGPA